MHRSLFLLAAALILGLPMVASPSWGTGGCIAAQAPVGADYRWVNHPSLPGQVSLYRGSVQVGAWDSAALKFRPYDAASDTWGTPTNSSPIAPPHGVFAAWQTGGVRVDKMNGFHESHSINGHEVPKEAAFAAIKKDTPIDDDSAKNYVIPLTKNPAERKALADAYKSDPALASLRERAILWDGPAADPDSDVMRDFRANKSLYGYKGGFALAMYDPTGGELFYEKGFPDSPEKMAALLGKLRRADPKYDPSLDPAPKKNDDIMPSLPPVFWVVLVIGGLILCVYIYNQNHEDSDAVSS